MERLVLASGSPRRRELLSLFNIPFSIHPSDCDESLPQGATPKNGALAVAERKAIAAAKAVGKERYVLAADTIVVVDGEVLGKPKDIAEAERMLSMLSGRSHKVITAVALYHNGEARSFAVTTTVTFRKLDCGIIKWYLSTGEPFDKAGGYGIQGLGSALALSIRGSYTNVVGLPVAQTLQLLGKAGLAPWRGESA